MTNKETFGDFVRTGFNSIGGTVSEGFKAPLRNARAQAKKKRDFTPARGYGPVSIGTTGLGYRAVDNFLTSGFQSSRKKKPMRKKSRDTTIIIKR